MVTNYILQRVFNIFCGGKSGTCFTVDVDGRQYIVTAHHLVEEIEGQGTVQIASNKTRKKIHVEVIEHVETQDISVLTATNWHSPSHPLHVTLEGTVLSQEVFFLGYPYGISSGGEHLNNGFPVPVVKRAIFSTPCIDEHGLFCLDGHNNEGFSGGPVVRMEGPEVFVIGVISGYLAMNKEVYDAKNKKTKNKIIENTGIVHAYPSDVAVGIIKSNPRGLRVPVDTKPSPPTILPIDFEVSGIPIRKRTLKKD